MFADAWNGCIHYGICLVSYILFIFLACHIGGADFERPLLFFSGGGGWWLMGRNEGIFHLFLGGCLVTSRTATGLPPASHKI